MTTTPRQCFYIPQTQYNDKGWVPSLVTEDEAGHRPMTGNGELSEPWYWGTTYEEALETCAKANADRGISPAEAKEIVDSSMIAAIREDAARTAANERYEKRFAH